MSDINDQSGNEVPENQPPAAPPPPPAGDAGATPPPPPAAGGSTPPPPPAAGGSTPPPPPAPPSNNAGAGAPPPPPPVAPGAGAVTDGPYTVGNAFTYAWGKFRENAGPIVIALLLYLVIGAVLTLLLNLISNAIAPASSGIVVDPNTGSITGFETGRSFAQILMATITSIITAIYGYIVSAGITRGVLKILRGEKLVLDDLLPKEKLPTVIVASIIVGVLSGIGYMLCFIPGLLVAFFTTFFLFFIYDKDKGAWESITSSCRFVMDHLVEVVVLFLASVVALFIGAILCGIGLIVAIPVVHLAMGYAYKKLNGEEVAPLEAA